MSDTPIVTYPLNQEVTMKIYHNDPLPPFNQLTPAEAERLAVLAGECGEVIQAIAKVLRHGYESKNPDILGCPTNREDLETEIGHVLVAASLLTRSGDLPAVPRTPVKATGKQGFFFMTVPDDWKDPPADV